MNPETEPEKWQKPANDNLRNLLGVTDFRDRPMIWVTDNTIYDPPQHLERCLQRFRLFTQCRCGRGADCDTTSSTDF